MFRSSNENDAFLEKTEDSTLRDDDTAQTLSFEITHDTTSLSPTESAANEDLLSSSAPVFIPAQTENTSHSASASPTQDLGDYDESTPYGSFAMSQSLKINDQLGHHCHLQRATSTGPRIERTENDFISTQSPSYEDPLFPFLNPDLGADMKNSDEQFKNSTPIIVNGTAKESQSGNEIMHKRKWQIMKGMSEINISPHWNTAEPPNNSMTVLNSSEVQPHEKLRGRQKYAASVKFANKPHLKRKTSISSNLSYVGTYLFGSTVFQSPARSQISMASDRVNFIVENAGMYPSLMSLTSFEVALEDEAGLHPSSKPRSVSAYNSRQNSGNDLQSLEKKRNFMRSNSATSRGSSSSLSTRIFRDQDDKAVNDEEADKLTEVKSVISRPQPSKKLWQQTMPDLEEGPESDTLTVQSTIQKNLAAAALAIAGKRDSDFKKDEEEDEEEVVVVEKVITQGTYTKNLLVLCFSYFASFASYMSLRNLQSSLNAKGGLGMISLSCVYASVFFGSILTTSIVQRLGAKLSIIISFLGLLIYNISNYYPSYATLIPGSISAGLSMAVTWTAQGTYLANNALASSEFSGKKFSVVLSSYQGIFFSSYQMSQVIGGLISSLLFSLQGTSQPSHDLSNSTSNSSTLEAILADSFVNTTHHPYSIINHTLPLLTTTHHSYSTINHTSNTNLSYHLANNPHPDHTCGMLHCPGQKSSELDIKIEPWVYLAMVTVFLCSVILAILVVALCLNPLQGVLKKRDVSLGGQMLCVFRILMDSSMLCLVPLMAYSLLQTTFMFGEFNKAHVTCVLGIHMIGYMTVFLSLFSSFFAFFSGNMQRYLGTEGIIIGGLMCHLLILSMFWVWTPSKESLVWFFVVVSVWGAGDGMIMAQIVSMLSTLFMDRKEAAFSAYKMVQSSSAFMMFMVGAYICTKAKAIILTVVLFMALGGIIVLILNKNIAKSIGKSKKTVLPVRDVCRQPDPASK